MEPVDKQVERIAELEARLAQVEQFVPFIVGLGQALQAAAADTNLKMMRTMLPPQVQSLLSMFDQD